MDTVLISCPGCRAANRVPADRLDQQPVCGKCKQALFAGKPVEASDADFDELLARTEIPVIVDFWASWCGPCRAFAPTFAAAAQQMEPVVRLVKLDTERNPRTAARYGIRSIPTLIAFHGGKELDRVSGALPPQQFAQWVRQATGL